MSDRIRQLLTTALVAVVAGSLAGVTSAALAQEAESAPEAGYETAGLDADTVDGRHAIGATGNKALRAKKLVATNRYGMLPSNIIRPRWKELKGRPADFLDGVIGWGEVRNKPAGFADGVDDVGYITKTWTKTISAGGYYSVGWIIPGWRVAVCNVIGTDRSHPVITAEFDTLIEDGSRSHEITVSNTDSGSSIDIELRCAAL